MKNDLDDDARSYCDDGCNLPWDDTGVVQLQAFLPISDAFLSCDWLAVATEPTVVFTRTNKQKYSKPGRESCPAVIAETPGQRKVDYSKLC